MANDFVVKGVTGPEGFWWVQSADWFGYAGGERQTRTPNFTYTLCRLPDPKILSGNSEATRNLFREASRHPPDTKTGRAPIGLLPSFAIGAVWHNDSPYGHLPTDTLKVTLSGGNASLDIVNARYIHKNLQKLRKDAKANPIPVIPSSEFYRGEDWNRNFIFAECLDGKRQSCFLAVPCSEIFRALTVPYPVLGNALGTLEDRPNEKRLDPLLNTSRMGRDSEGISTIYWRNGIKEEMLPYIYHLAYDHEGGRTIQDFLAHMKKTRRTFERSPLSLRPPMTWEKLELTISGYRIFGNSSRIVGLRILAHSYSPVPKIAHRADNDNNEGTEQIQTDRPQPFYKAPPESSRDANDRIIIDPHEDASHQSALNKIPSCAPIQLSPPILKKIEKEISYKYEKQIPQKSDEFSIPASAGAVGAGGSKQRIESGEHLQIGEADLRLYNRLIEVNEFFTLLHSKNMLTYIGAVSDALSPNLAPQFDLPIWTFQRAKEARRRVKPRQTKFVYFNPDAASPPFRRAAVFRIKYKQHDIVVLTIGKNFHGETCASLIFKCFGKIELAVEELLNLLAIDNGNWPSRRAIQHSIPSIGAITFWQHTRSEKQNPLSDLSSVTLFNRLHEVCV